MLTCCARLSLLAALAGLGVCQAQSLQVVNQGRPTAHLTYRGKPLFAFGPMNEHLVWQAKLGSELYDVRGWAKWQQANGMNYVRCYPASGYGWTREIIHHPDYLFPFETASTDPLKFDVTRFNPEYWRNFRAVAQTLRDHGIIVHLQVFQLCYFETNPAGDRWPFNFWNPSNNVNDFARSMRPNGGGHHPIVEQVVEGNPGLRNQYLAYLDHLLAAVGDLGNVFLDLSNEMGDGGLDLDLTRRWIELTLDHIQAWEKTTGHDLLVGQDMACFPDKDYLLGHPRLELAIIHGNHVWRDWTSLRRPVVIVNSNDGQALLYAAGGEDRFPRFRKLHWRALMSRVQGIGDYQKEWRTKPGSFPQFDRDARLLRRFFDSLVDFPNLLPRPGCLASAPAAASYCLASRREAVVYCESGPRAAGVQYPAAELRLNDLPLRGRAVRVTIYSPAAGPLRESEAALRNGTLDLSLPAFTDDLAVHLVAR